MTTGLPFSRVPVNEFLGLRLDHRSQDSAAVSVDARPEFVQEEGVFHGGIISAIADTAAVYLFHPDLAEGETMASIESSVNFLRPARAGGDPIVATSTRIRRGAQVGVADVQVRQGETLVARGTFTYLFYRKKE